MPATTQEFHSDKSEFQTAFERLSSAWVSHEELKTAGAPITDLANSNANLFQARVAMGCWRRRNQR